MSRGKSQAGEGKSNNRGMPEPTGTNTAKKAMAMLEQEQKVEQAVESLDEKGKGAKVDFENEAGKRTFNP